MISIVVPVYNAETTIDRCIDSVIQQTYRDWELILVDDGSADTSYRKCRQYEQACTQIHVLQQSNSGAAAARNYGIEYATGQYLCFLDSDDYLEPTALEALLNGMQDGADFTYAGYRNQTIQSGRLIASSDRVPPQAGGKRSDLPESFFVDGWMHSCWGKAYRRDILCKHSIRFPKDMRLSEDSMFNISYLGHVCAWRSVDSAIYTYCNTVNSGSVTKKIFPQAFEWYLRVYDSLLDLLLTIYPRAKAESTCLHTIYPQYWATIRKLCTADSPDAIDALTEASQNSQICTVLRKAKKSAFENLIVHLFIRKRWKSMSWAFHCYRYYAEHWKR